MGSTKLAQGANTPISSQINQISQPKARLSVWGRMLSLGLAGLMVVGSVSTLSADNRKEKKEPEPVSASRTFEFDGIKRIITVKTQDNWNHIFESWNNHPHTRTLPLGNLIKALNGVFVNRHIDLGKDSCETYIVIGDGKHTFGLAFTAFFTTSDGRTTFKAFDTEIPIQNTTIALEQSAETCMWTARFSRFGKPFHVLRFSNSGDVVEDRKLTTKK